MEESTIINQLKKCKAVYVSYNIFFYKVTQPCLYLTSINKEAYIGIKIDDFYFSNEDAGYSVKLEAELSEKRKVVIYGVYADGSLLILEGYKTEVSKLMFSDLDATNKADPIYFTYRLSDIKGAKYTLNHEPERIEDSMKWVVKDEEDHYYADAEPALHYFRERIRDYFSDSSVFVPDEVLCQSDDLARALFLPLYNFFLEKRNKGTLSEEEIQVINAVELILLSFGFDERVDEDDFMLFRLIRDAVKEEKHYEYEGEGYQIKIVLEKELFEVNLVNNETYIHLKTNALSTKYSGSYFFDSQIRILNDEMAPEDHNLHISYAKFEGEAPL